jgi:hypothetical protein
MLSNGLKGTLLGAANVCVVALGFAVMEFRDASEAVQVFWLVAIIGMLPGMGTGLVLGTLAGRLEHGRLPILVTLALAMVVLLGTMLGTDELILLASIPTIAAASILERWTRRQVDPQVPPARARQIVG